MVQDVNRNQIGAVVGNQPCGGEGLSGTGPKAGGPWNLKRFSARPIVKNEASWSQNITISKVSDDLKKLVPSHFQTKSNLLGPTDEANRISHHSKATILCAGVGLKNSNKQAELVKTMGGTALAIAGDIEAEALSTLGPIGGVIWWGNTPTARAYEKALARCDGAIIPLIRSLPDLPDVLCERHICIDTTAAGGNADLLGSVS